MDPDTFADKKDQIKKVKLNDSILVSPGPGNVLSEGTEVSREGRPELFNSLILTHDNIGETEDDPIQVVEWKGTTQATDTEDTAEDTTDDSGSGLSLSTSESEESEE